MRCWVISECSSYKISNRPCHTLSFALPYISIALPQWGYNTGIWIHSDCNQLNRNSQLLEFRREILTWNERFFGESARYQKIAIEIKIIENAMLLFDKISLYVVSILGSSQELGIWCLQKKWADIAWVYKVFLNIWRFYHLIDCISFYLAIVNKSISISKETVIAFDFQHIFLWEFVLYHHARMWGALTRQMIRVWDVFTINKSLDIYITTHHVSSLAKDWLKRWKDNKSQVCIYIICILYLNFKDDYW